MFTLTARALCALSLIGGCCAPPKNTEVARFEVIPVGPTAVSIELTDFKWMLDIGSTKYYVFDEYEDVSPYHTILHACCIQPNRDADKFGEISGTVIIGNYAQEPFEEPLLTDNSHSEASVKTDSQPITYHKKIVANTVHTSSKHSAIVTTPVQIMYAGLRGNRAAQQLQGECGDDKSKIQIFEYVESQRRYMQAEKILTLFGLKNKTLTIPESETISKTKQLDTLKSVVEDLQKSRVPENKLDETCMDLIKSLEFDICAITKDESADPSKYTVYCFVQLCSLYSESSADQIAIDWMDRCSWIIENDTPYRVMHKCYHDHMLCVVVTEEVLCSIARNLNSRVHHNLFTLASILTGLHDVFLLSQSRRLDDTEQSRYNMLAAVLSNWAANNSFELHDELQSFMQKCCAEYLAFRTKTSFNSYIGQLADYIRDTYDAPGEDTSTSDVSTKCDRGGDLFNYVGAASLLSLAGMGDYAGPTENEKDDENAMPQIITTLLDYTKANFNKQ